jgi:hypothetical protein
VQFDATISVPSATSPGNYSVSVTGSDQTGAPTAGAVLNVPVVPFQFDAGTTSQTVAAGQPAKYSLSITPIAGNFQAPVSFACLNLPPHASCSFNPPSVAAGAPATSVALTISTIESSPSALISMLGVRFLALCMGIAGTLIGGADRRSRFREHSALRLLPLALSILLISCGGGGGGGGNPPPLPPLPVSLSVRPTSALVRTSASQQFTATMSPSNSQVSWDVNGTIGGNSTMGTISSSGLYRAPAALPSVAVVVRASAQADPSKAATASVVVQAPTPPGVYDVTVSATEGSGSSALTRLLTLHLTVR